MTEYRFMIVIYAIIIVCITIIYALLFVSLWQYKELVGASLLVLLFLVVIIPLSVHARGKLNEQEIRNRRFAFKEEIPLDVNGEPVFLPKDAQVNPNRKTYM